MTENKYLISNKVQNGWEKRTNYTWQRKITKVGDEGMGYMNINKLILITTIAY